MSVVTTDGTSGSGRQCGYCGAWHTGACPRVKSIEYHPDGSVKRVEFFPEPHPFPPPYTPIPPYSPPPTLPPTYPSWPPYGPWITCG